MCALRWLIHRVQNMNKGIHENVSDCGRLLRLIALGLQLPSSFFDASFDAATSNVRAIHYLAGKHSAQDGVFGVGALLA